MQLVLQAGFALEVVSLLGTRVEVKKDEALGRSLTLAPTSENF
jgi:hypothetical protein